MRLETLFAPRGRPKYRQADRQNGRAPAAVVKHGATGQDRVVKLLYSRPAPTASHGKHNVALFVLAVEVRAVRRLRIA